MGLKLSLKPHERVIVNGCILRNGPRRQVLEVENRADVLRGDEMLDAQTAQTPVRKLAYQLQIALVSQLHRGDLQQQIEHDLQQLTMALPRFAALFDTVGQAAQARNFYLAFRSLAPAIAYEEQLFAHLESVQQ